MLHLDLTLSRPGFTLDAAFDAPAGITSIFGRSGAGKTSIVNCVSGLIRPDRGHVVLDGTVLTDTGAGIFAPVHRRRIGYVFQDGRLFPHLTVRRNLGFGARFAPRDAPGPGLDAVAALLGIGHLLDRRPASLSGGERARLGIGRALMARPRLMILDEPMAALDAPRRAEIMPWLERLRDEAGVPMLHISHDIAEVARLATTLVLLDAGRVIRSGPLAEVLADPVAAAGLETGEAGAVLEGRVAAAEADGLVRVETSAGALLLAPPGATPAPGTALRLRIRAQDVILSLDRPQGSSALNVLRATVTALRAEGPLVLITLRLPGEAVLLARITARSAAALGLERGLTVHALIKTAALG